MTTPAHTVAVMSLYRRSLRCMMNWAIDSKVIRTEHVRIRKLFEKNRNGDGPALLKSGEKTLAEYTHPDPHIMCWAEGGSKWQRNVLPGEARVIETPTNKYT